MKKETEDLEVVKKLLNSTILSAIALGVETRLIEKRLLNAIQKINKDTSYRD